MERLPRPTIGRHVRGGETGDLERPLVDEQARAVGGEGPDQHRNIVDRHLQLALGFARLLLGALSILNVGYRSIPCDDLSGFIARRRWPEQEPAILAVETPQARLAVNGLPGGHIRASDLDELLEVVGVN